MTSAPHSRRYSSFRPLIFADPKKTQEEWTYIAQMGSRTAFKLDANATPKAEFMRVAIHYLGWTAGDQEWCTHWKKCFGEDYRYHCPSDNKMPYSDAGSKKESPFLVVTSESRS